MHKSRILEIVRFNVKVDGDTLLQGGHTDMHNADAVPIKGINIYYYILGT